MSTLKNIQIIHKTEDFLVINKPAGLLVHPANNKNEESLVDFLLEKFPEVKNVGDRPDIRPGIVHRLDRNTSGIMVVARNQKFFNYFKSLLKDRKVKKIYTALLWGKLEKGVISSPIGLKPNTTRWSTRGNNLKMVKDAVTEYEAIDLYKKDKELFTLTKLYPKTGRTHQLRVHMASIHHSVVGDSVYGRKEDPFNLNRQFLHAKSIEFKTKSGEIIKLEAPLTDDLVRVINTLEKA